MNRPLETTNVRTSRRWLAQLTLVAAAITFGGIGVYATRGYIDSSLSAERALLAEQGRTVGVLVAQDDLSPGALVDTNSIAVRQIPAHVADDSMIVADRFEEVMGQTIAVPMVSGEPIRRAGLSVGDDAFSTRLRHGVRAMTVVVDEVNGVSGMLRPGDRLDLLLTVHEPGVGVGAIATPLMQDLRILATGSHVATDARALDAPEGYRAITLEVTPLQAQKLVLAQRSGRLTALLRNPDDRFAMPQQALDLSTLLGRPKPAQAPPASTGPEIIIGGQGPIRRAKAVNVVLKP